MPCSPLRPPVLAAWGAGVDSTAMLIELVERGEPVDMVLFADVGGIGEKAGTRAFVPVFRAWLADRGVPSEVVRYRPKNFKNWPPYYSLTENLLTNGTLPGIAFGRGTCSQKWKAAPQHAWAQTWPPAQAAWAAVQGYAGSAREDLAVEFFTGAMVARHAAGMERWCPPAWYAAMLGGQAIGEPADD